MCGICGIYNFKTTKPVNKEEIRTMTSTMIHRGPDDDGYYFDNSLGFGFRRLSIIDLSGGHQPMCDKDKQIWVIFNGEIYNFKVLKKELTEYGYTFQTNSDTEVIIIGYKKWGADVVNHLNGMFGFALWDSKNKKLLLARDRMGIKNVYYKLDNNGLTFGSEIHAITSLSKQMPDIDQTSLYLFLQYRYTPAPYTIFYGIKKLAPGSYILIEEGKLHIKRWWRYKPKLLDYKFKIKDIEENLLFLYKKAIERHIISDVPLGLLLSGGIDSGLLLALMNTYGKDWKTFTVGYGKDYKDDELIDAEYTARMLKSEHSSIMIDKSTFEESLPKIISYLEEPIATSSIVPMYHVCKLAREKVTVALIGQGPDELYGGYKRHLGVYYGNYWRALPKFIRDSGNTILTKMTSSESIYRGLYSLDENNRMKRYQKVFSLHSDDVIEGLFKDGMLEKESGDKIIECWQDMILLIEQTDELGGFQFFEVRSSLPDELLMYADKLSMAHSLELRVPYLDYKIVEYVESLPSSLKISFGKRKWIHKKICSNFLPKEIVKRKKRAFASNVVDNWFNTDISNKFNNYFNDPGSLMYKYLKNNKVHNLLKEHQNKIRDNHKILFSLILFEEWLRIVL